jgi:molybdenum ABC transporter molybdate-binding protein
VLETQAEQGAPFDIFISADRGHIAALADEHLVGAPALLSQGHEVIVVPKGDPAGIHSLRDLANKPVKLVLGTDTVPIGIYSRQVLANAAADYGAGFPAEVLGHAVSFETNVKQVLEKVALGEADAGIVYFTDVTKSYAAKVEIVGIPEKFEVESANYIAVASQSKQPALASALAAYAVGSEGRTIFLRHAYDPIR